MAHARKIITHDIQLNLSMEEAQLVKVLIGKLTGEQGKSIWEALDSVHVSSTHLEVYPDHASIAVYTLHIK